MKWLRKTGQPRREQLVKKLGDENFINFFEITLSLPRLSSNKVVRWVFVIFICVIVVGGTGAGVGIAVQNSMDKNASNETTEEKFKYDLLE